MVYTRVFYKFFKCRSNRQFFLIFKPRRFVVHNLSWDYMIFGMAEMKIVLVSLHFSAMPHRLFINEPHFSEGIHSAYFSAIFFFLFKTFIDLRFFYTLLGKWCPSLLVWNDFSSRWAINAWNPFYMQLGENKGKHVTLDFVGGLS